MCEDDEDDGLANSLDKVRTALVVVHGMGEQRPLETLNRFTETAIPKVGGERRYFSRPTRITDSFEARRHIAFRQEDHGLIVHGQADLYEYHWSYMMTGNRLRDLLPLVRRMLLRSPGTVPQGLRFAWALAWVVLLAFLVVVVRLVVGGSLDEYSLKGVLAGLLGTSVGALVVLALLRWVGGAVTASFVDVVRYLDDSPRSYEVRRRIRKGMVDLLRELHQSDRYSRIIVVAHSLGGYIAYDGITALWPELAPLHTGDKDAAPTSLDGLLELQKAAATSNQPQYRAQQSVVWKNARRQGNPWLVTDLITLGTPMYFADLLYTRNRDDFSELVRRSELPVCPPISNSTTAEAEHQAGSPRYGYHDNDCGPEVLGSSCPFAVVRWTNLWFPTVWGAFGDWFGGPLQPLFGLGVDDRKLLGNKPGRFLPAAAHTRYFSYPDDLTQDSVTRILQDRLRLDDEDSLTSLLSVPRVKVPDWS